MRFDNTFSNSAGYQKQCAPLTCLASQSCRLCHRTLCPAAKHPDRKPLRTQIVMRDRVTGEARGFGFVTVESAAADTVERSEHIIGGRKV